MSNLEKTPTMKNDEVEEWGSSIFNPPKHQFQKMSPSRKKQKLDDAPKLGSTPPRSFRDSDIAIKLSLSQDEHSAVDIWNSPRASPRSFQDGLFASSTFDFSLPATPPRHTAELAGAELTSPPEIKKQFSLDCHKMSPQRFPTFPTGVQQLVAPSSPKIEAGTMFQEIQGRIQHLSPGQTLYNVASNSDGGSPYRTSHAWSMQLDEANADGDTSLHFSPPLPELRGAQTSSCTKVLSASEPITPSHAHIYQTISNETSSPAITQPTMHQDGLKTVDYTPETKFSTPNAVTNVSGDGGVQYNTPSTWSQAPLPPFVSREGEIAHPELLPRPPQSIRQASFRMWDPNPIASQNGSLPQFLLPVNSVGYNQALHSFHPDRATSSTGVTGNDPNWNQNLTLLKMYQSRFGHCRVPVGYGIGTEYEGLHTWCQEQLVEYQKICHGESSAMTVAQRNILMELGFTAAAGFRSKRTESESSKASWRKWMAKLTAYRAENGHVDVPLKYEPCPSLGTFVNRQRTEWRKLEAGKPSNLTPARIKDLNRLGFTWTKRESHVSWEARFKELQRFKDTNGHCNVPKGYKKHPALGCWVSEQKCQYRRYLDKKPSYMTEDRVRALKEIGFRPTMREKSTSNNNWKNWMRQLRDYKKEHGDVDVPLKYSKNIALGAFVNRQRTEYRKLQKGSQSSLTDERLNDLNELGFKWQMRVSRTPWDQRLKELIQFKEEQGHCNVPSTWPENQPLAYWVFKQRGQYRLFKQCLESGKTNNRCNMTADRIEKLDALGFDWNPPRKGSKSKEEDEEEADDSESESEYVSEA